MKHFSILRRAAIGIAVGASSLAIAFPAFAMKWVNLGVDASNTGQAISFTTDGTKGLAAFWNDAKLFHTTNGGQTWTENPTIAGNQFYAISFVPNSTRAYLVGGNGLVARIDDPAVNSVVLENSNSANTTFFGVSTVDSQTAWAVGTGGKIIRTTDSVTWQSITSNTTQALYGIKMINATTGWAVGDNGTLLYWASQLNAWFNKGLNETNSLSGIDFGSPLNGIAVGNNGTMWRTGDAGQTWQKVNLSGVINTTAYLTSVRFLDATHVIAGGSFGTVIMSDDAGLTWSANFLPSTTAVQTLYIKSYAPFDAFAGESGRGMFRYDAKVPTGPAGLTILGGNTNPIDNKLYTNTATPKFSWLAPSDAETWILEQVVEQGTTPISATATQYTVPTKTDGPHQFTIYARDAGDNYSNPVATYDYNVDTVAPTFGAITPTTANANQAVTIQATYGDGMTGSGVASCNLWVDGADKGAMTLTDPNEQAGTAKMMNFTFTTGGTHNVQLKCTDVAGNQGSSAVTPVSVSGGNPPPPPPPADTTPFASTSNVSASPSSVSADNSTTATVTVTVKNKDGVALSGKSVSLSSSRPSSDTIVVLSGTTNSSGQATFSVKSSSVGSSVFTAVSGVTITQTATVTFTTPAPTPTPTPTPTCQNPVMTTGSLVKLSDDGNPNTQEDTAVYYYGKDCKRHAFPNSKVYFTWYVNFDSVTVVPLSTLASMPLGKNVTYRPGVKMVKFTTVNTVYAVAKGGVLRAIASEAVAIALYGATWNKQIDDINDAFYANYLFGANINAASDYNVTAELAGATTIDASL